MRTDAVKQRILDLIANITPLDSVAMEQARARQQVLTKPADGLGRLEDLAVQIAGITGQAVPTLERKAVIVMAGDHGVTVEGVSAYPADVTVQMVSNFLRGGAAINALARHADAQVVVVDVGVTAEIEEPGLVSRKVTPGTANMVCGPAMTEAQMLVAIQVGIDVLGVEVARVTGRGTGIDGFIIGARPSSQLRSAPSSVPISSQGTSQESRVINCFA